MERMVEKASETIPERGHSFDPVAQEKFIALSSDLFAVLDEGWHLKTLNHRWQEILGWKAKELKSKFFPVIIHPDERKSLLQLPQQIHAQQPSARFECRVMKRNGLYIKIAWTLGKNERSLYLIGHEITQKWHLERELDRLRQTSSFHQVITTPVATENTSAIDYAAPLKSKIALLEMTLQHCLDHITLIDREGIIRYTNRDTMVGSRHEMIGHHMLDYTESTYRKLVVEKVSHAFETGEPVFYRLLGNINKGCDLRVRLNPIKIEQQVVGAVLACTNIPEEIAFDNQLKESRDEMAWYTFAVNQLCLFAQMDSEGCITYANDNTLNISGIQFENLLGKFFLSFCSHLHHSQQSLSDIWQHIQAGKIWRGELCFQPSNGVEFWSDTMIVPVMGTDAQPLRYLILAVDVTEKHLALQRLEEERARSFHAAKMASLGEMAGGVAHEINNPLATIQAAARRIMRESSQRCPEIIQSVEWIEKMTNRIAKIIGGLRAFAREGQMDPFTVVKLSTIIDDTIALCRHRFVAHDISFFMDPIQHDIEIECRNVQIVQVLLNLLNNAFDAVEPLAQRWVKVVYFYDDKWLTFSVSNAGPKIPDEIIGKLMQPFFTTKPLGKGTGLGLSISKGLVESHHGQLYYDPAQEFTTFILRIPILQSVETKE